MSNEQGCYDKRGLDYETAMVMEIHDTLIDAARLVRLDWDNGMPNWELFRLVYAGDSMFEPVIRDWAAGYSMAFCKSGGVQRRTYSDEFAAIAGWDALHIIMHHKPMWPVYSIAADLSVDRETYERLRNTLARIWQSSIDEYRGRLLSDYIKVFWWEKRNK